VITLSLHRTRAIVRYFDKKIILRNISKWNNMHLKFKSWYFCLILTKLRKKIYWCYNVMKTFKIVVFIIFFVSFVTSLKIMTFKFGQRIRVYSRQKCIRNDYSSFVLHKWCWTMLQMNVYKCLHNIHMLFVRDLV